MPLKYRDVKFAKTTTLLGQEISLNNTTTKAAQDRLNKARTSWGLIKQRGFLDHEIHTKARLQLRNAAIYSILDYGQSTLKITEAMQIKIQQCASKCIRRIVEAGKNFGVNPNERASEHDANEEIRRINHIPTIESRLQGGALQHISAVYNQSVHIP